MRYPYRTALLKNKSLCMSNGILFKLEWSCRWWGKIILIRKNQNKQRLNKVVDVFSIVIDYILIFPTVY